MAAGRGGVAGWSIHHPIGVVMITAAVLVLGALALGRLPVDLLPQITYPEIRVRILDPGVPAEVMEDRVTRQLEEQLAITEDAIAVQSRTTEGASAVDCPSPTAPISRAHCRTPARGSTAPSVFCPTASTRRSSSNSTPASCRWRSSRSARRA
jgi:hypothetical protein